jgi:hypothetical protein
MIIGRGDIASVLIDREDRLYFASGVSNSEETRETEYEREATLLIDQDKWRHIVYFSSLCVFYTDTRYAQHKRMMEKVVKKYFGHYTIIRLGNITWGKNPHTLINYMKTHKDAEVKDVYRYVVDKEEFLHWMELIPEWSCEMNVPGRMLKVKDIIKEYV